MEHSEQELYKAILKLENVKECEAFFKDLCTPKEIDDMKGRLLVAKLLYDEKLSYREINNKTKVSLATITRVSRFLTQEAYQGYKLIFNREKNEQN